MTTTDADGRTILLVADSHVGQETDDDQDLVAFLDEISPARTSALYVLGDGFHYLIGDRKFATPTIDRALAALDRVRSRGIPTYYIEGNRDFFLDGSFVEPLFTAIALSFSVETPSGRYHLTHGDLINDRDWPYRFWRFASKNPVSRFAMHLVPRSRGRYLVSGVEGRLRRTNFKHKRQLPLELIRSFARQRWMQGDDIVLLGHFHEEWFEPDTSGKAVGIVPAWCESRRVGWIDGRGRYTTGTATDYLAFGSRA